MKRNESEIKRSQLEEQCVESERPNEEPMSKDFSRVPRRERRKADKGDYESLFICRNTLKNRKTIYIAKELQDTLAEIVMSMRNRDMTIGIYVENIILHHLEIYKDEINRLAEMNFRKLL
ncbi:conjugative transposon protein TraB [Prevotella intermedia]|uniref:Conjugative transposon protein TraB n=2 Tax=Prevotella intermedia TaxID=28131 RepID=A0AAD1F7R4_PREIN|nr:conjugative transposon protein TraB [Prevotella intermedia]